jgi:hypothetical protein
LREHQENCAIIDASARLVKAFMRFEPVFGLLGRDPVYKNAMVLKNTASPSRFPSKCDRTRPLLFEFNSIWNFKTF